MIISASGEKELNHLSKSFLHICFFNLEVSPLPLTQTCNGTRTKFVGFFWFFGFCFFLLKTCLGGFFTSLLPLQCNFKVWIVRHSIPERKLNAWEGRALRIIFSSFILQVNDKIYRVHTVSFEQGPLSWLIFQSDIRSMRRQNFLLFELKCTIFFSPAWFLYLLWRPLYPTESCHGSAELPSLPWPEGHLKVSRSLQQNFGKLSWSTLPAWTSPQVCQESTGSLGNFFLGKDEKDSM